MGRIFSVFLLITAVFLGAYFILAGDGKLAKPSPVVFGSNTTTVKNGWFPKAPPFYSDKSDLVIGAKAAMLVNFDTGEILYQKNIRQKLPVASTVKIMTALLGLEYAEKSKFFVSEKAATVGEDSMGLKPGEKLAVEELLYGLMLPSGNDAAVATAEGISGSEDRFVTLMNETAKDLGMSDTKFINASGLDEDGREQFSTAFDMVTLAHFVWDKYPLFRKVTSTEHMVIEANDEHGAYDLYNQTNLLTTYPGVRGIKPGFTWEAGLCLVTYAENENVRLIGLILGSNDRRGEMKELLDYGFGKYGIKVDHPALD